MRKRLTLVLIAGVSFAAASQPQTLTDYVNIALESNVTLKQKNYSYEQSLEALKEAKRMYFPIVSIEARYAVSEGGRTVTVPFGEMMNPAYENLNLINQSLRQINPIYPNIPEYPEIEDYVLNFIREREHETKVQVVMPVFNSAIIHNHKIKEDLAQVEKVNVDIYKRELSYEVKSAYLNYLRSLKQIELYENTLEVVHQSLKSTQVLFENNKITKDELFSAEAQVKEIEKLLSEANKNELMSKAFFNFLLNRDFYADIELVELQNKPFTETDLQVLQTRAIASREEVQQANQYLHYAANQVNNQKGTALPELTLYATYGYQGEQYSFTREDDFAQAGLNLSWEIFNSGQRKSRVQQARIERDMLDQKKVELERQIQMEVMDARYSIETANKGLELANEETNYYQQAHELMLKKYQQGMVNHLEYSFALNNLLNAENKSLLAGFDVLQSLLNMERILADEQIIK